MVRRTYDGWGYSPLDQITPANIARLQPAWVFSTGVNNGHEAAPIINNGVMFVATPGNQVIALDAKNGTLLWRYRRPLPEDVIFLHPTSRGVALFGNTVLFASGDAGPIEQWRIERHVRACAECRETVAQYSALRSEITESGAPEDVSWNKLAATWTWPSRAACVCSTNRSQWR